LAFQAIGWIGFLIGFAGHFPISCGCLALANYFSCRRGQLAIKDKAFDLIRYLPHREILPDPPRTTGKF
jgi:hypothetical protein